MNIEAFLNKFDEHFDEMVNDEAAHGIQFQKYLERTCAVELKKTFPMGDKKCFNYWWNEELSVLRKTTLSNGRRAQQAVATSRDNAGNLVAAFKETRRRLKRAIERSKEEKWREFCATLNQDPWGRPYRAIRVKMARRTPPDGLRMDRVASILDDLFVTKRGEQGGDVHRPRITQTH
jgi:hypothetical protein